MIARVLICLLVWAIHGQAAPLLSVDFNDRTNNPATTTFPGFASFLITSNVSATALQTNATVRTIGAYRLTLSATGLNPGYNDRNHALPINQGAFTESLLLRENVYSPDTSPSSSLNLLIENLPASARVKVTIWSFDAISGPVRSSDWYANGVLVRSNYQFNNTSMPVSNEECRFSFKGRVDASGRLRIEGRRNPLSANADNPALRNPGVYLNALQIEPEPLEIVGVALAGTELRLTFVVRPQPGGYEVEERLDAGGPWRTVSGVQYGTALDNLVTARFGRPSGARVYRVRYQY